jgi:hypothetical protein
MRMFVLVMVVVTTTKIMMIGLSGTKMTMISFRASSGYKPPRNGQMPLVQLCLKKWFLKQIYIKKKRGGGVCVQQKNFQICLTCSSVRK